MNKIFRLFVISFVIILAQFSSAAQTNYEEVVYLKNGSIIHGVIIEQVPNYSIKIQTKDGNIFVYKLEEIEKITKEVQLNIKKVKLKKKQVEHKKDNY